MASIFGLRYIASMGREKTVIARATVLIVISALSFGSISVLTILVTSGGVSLLVAMAWRYLIASLILGVLVDRRSLHRLEYRRILQLLLIGGCGQALITYVSLHALEYIGVGPLAFLFYTYPAWVALLAALRGAERLTVVRVVALVTALAGVTIMIGAPMAEHLDPLGVSLALASALLYSAYLPALEHVQRGIPALTSTFLLVAGAGITFVTVSLFSGSPALPAGFAVWTNISILALVSTVIAFATLIKGLSVLGPVRTSIIATVEPFFTAILGVIVLGNVFSVTTLAGGVLIGAAILAIEWSSTRLEATPPPQSASDVRFL